MPLLVAELKAEIQNLKAKLKEAQGLFKKTGEASDQANKKIASSGKQGMGALNRETKNVTPTLIEFNRVIQDAPFGILGVSNNITQLTQSFGYLKRESGGTKAALKALAKGFLGTNGVLFAVSAVTSLLVVYGDELLDAATGTKKLAEASSEFVSSAKAEINTLTTLLDIAQDKANVDKVRLGAIAELNKEYGEYLGNLDLENIKSSETAASVNALTNSLLKQAQVRGVEKAIAQVYEDSGEKLVELLLGQKEAAKAVGTELKRLTKNPYFTGVDTSKGPVSQIQQILKITKEAKKSGQDLNPFLGTLNYTTKQFKEAKQDLTDFNNEVEGELKSLQELFKDTKIQDLFAEYAEFDSEGVTVIGEKLKKGTDKFKNTFKNLDDIFGIKEAVQNSLDTGEGAFQAIEITLDQFGNSVGGALRTAFDKAAPELARIEKLMVDFNKDLKEIIDYNIGNTFAGLGDAIGNAIAEGGNLGEKLIQSLLSSMGSMLIELGELAIATGVGILAVQEALKSLNPYLAIAAGVALIAIGTAFSAGAAQLGKSGGSQGSVSGQGSKSSGSFGTQKSFGARATQSSGRVVFVIKGNELVGVLRNTLDDNARLGGGLNI